MNNLDLCFKILTWLHADAPWPHKKDFIKDFMLLLHRDPGQLVIWCGIKRFHYLEMLVEEWAKRWRKIKYGEI